jgi:hypothetical protein
VTYSARDVDGAWRWLNQKIHEGKGSVSFSLTEDGAVGISLFFEGLEGIVTSDYSAHAAVNAARELESEGWGPSSLRPLSSEPSDADARRACYALLKGVVTAPVESDFVILGRALLRLARENDHAKRAWLTKHDECASALLRAERAEAELAGLRTIVAAAENWADAPMGNANIAVGHLTDAVDAYRAARAKRVGK